MTREPDYYALLGVSAGSQDVVIEAAYRALMQKYDPQVAPSVNAAKKRADLTAAFAVLGDPKSRAEYDKRRGHEAPEHSAASSVSTTTVPHVSAAPVGEPAPKTEVAPRAARPGDSDWKTVLWVGAGLIALVSLISALSETTDTNTPSNSVMNVDENLTTTDMNTTSLPTEVNATESTPTRPSAEKDQPDNHVSAIQPETRSGTSPPSDGQDTAAAGSAPVGPTRAMGADIRSIFTADDYPASALATGAEGTAQATLTIGSDGRVLDCTLIRSTGNNSLDEATCSVIRRRARFTPARDVNGKPTVDFVTTPLINWRLTE